MGTNRSGKVQAQLVLMAAFIIAAGTWIIAQRTNQPDRSEQIKAQKHISPELYLVKDEDIDKVVVEKGEQKVVLEKRGPHWQMTEPLDVRADTSRVNDIIRAVRTLEPLPKTDPIIGSRSEPLKLGEYKLDKPELVATLHKGKTTYALLVGDETELGGAKAGADKGIYVKLTDEDVVSLVRPRDLESLKKEPKDLRQKQLVTTSRWNADFAKLDWPDRKLTVTKSKDKWRLVEPIADRADQNKVGELIGKVADLRVDKDEDFVDDKFSDPAKYGLDKPQLVAEIRRDSVEEEKDDKEKSKTDKAEKKKKEPVIERLLIGGPVDGREDKVYAQIDGQKYVVAVAASVLADLAKQPNDLRSRDLVELQTFDVDYVRVERPDGTVAMGKKDFEWELFQPKTIRAESATITDFVKKIDDLEIKEFIDSGDAADYGLDKPAATVSIYQKGLKPDDDATSKTKDKKKDDKKEEKKDDTSPPEPKGTPTQVLFGKRDEEKKLVYAKRGDEPGIFAVADEGLWDLVSRNHLAYRRKQVLSFLEFDVAKLVVHRDDKEFAVERKKEKEGDTKETWRLTAPLDAPADSLSVTDILNSLRSLNAKKFYTEGDADLAQYGLDAPKIRATVTMKESGDKQEQHVLLIGNEEEGGAHYAKLGNENLIFSVEQSIVKYLRSELFSHSVLQFDSAKVESVMLTWPDAKMELANKKPEGKTTKEWSVVGDDEFKLDVAKVRDFLTFLANLNSEQFAQYEGAFTEAQGLDKPALLVEVKLEGETDAKSLRVGAATEDEKRYVATAASTGPVALLAESRLKNYLAGPQHFAITEEKKPDEKKPEAEKAEDAKKDDEPANEPSERKPETKSEEKKSDDAKPDANPESK
jgi:ribosomal protein L12E/L44/L45/RPP1/RPP2